jgi:predicted transposase/invertase (TIGR01784 family)
MKLPEEERKAYEVYQEDLHYQASMFESSYGDGYYEGKVEGRAEGKAEGIDQATKNIAFNLIKQGMAIDQVVMVTGLSESAINELLFHENR